MKTSFSEISPSEFFYRNRDLAGFSNPTRALYMTIRELVENSLDACDQANILPNIYVSIKAIIEGQDPKQYIVKVKDNGPGISDEHLPKAFGRVLYGTKFTLKQSRGMFGLGATMAILYGQITTNKPVKIVSAYDNKLYKYTILLDIQRNRPLILDKEVTQIDNNTKGLEISITLEGDFSKAQQKIREYIAQTSLITPYANITFEDPSGNIVEFKRIIEYMPNPAIEVQPHPAGTDVETLRRLINKELNIISYITEDMKEKVRRELNARVNQSIPVLKDLAIKKWDKLTRDTKMIVSLAILLDMSIDDLDKIKIDKIDPNIQEISYITLNDESYHTTKLNSIEPFYNYILSIVDGIDLITFLVKNFQRVGLNTAKRFLEYANFSNKKIGNLSNDEIVKLSDAMQRYPGFLPPDHTCLSPLGDKFLEQSMKVMFEPEFVSAIQRPASAYSGFPFIVEVGIAYGGNIKENGIKLYRFANRIPLLYDEGSDISWKVIKEIDWKRYKVSLDSPLIIVTHICSTKVPYKTVGKEYVADRPEIEYELKNGLRFLARRLFLHLSKKKHAEIAKKRANLYTRYLPLLAQFSKELIDSKRLPKYELLIDIGNEYEEEQEDRYSKEQEG